MNMKILLLALTILTTFAQVTNEWGLLTFPETYVKIGDRIFSKTNGFTMYMAWLKNYDQCEDRVITNEFSVLETNRYCWPEKMQFRLRNHDGRWPFHPGDEEIIVDLIGDYYDALETRVVQKLMLPIYSPAGGYYLYNYTVDVVRTVGDQTRWTLGFCTNGTLNCAYIDLPRGGTLRYNNISTTNHAGMDNSTCPEFYERIQ